MKFSMAEVASQAISSTQVDIGDSFTFEVEMDIPGISIEDKSDLKVEVFGIDPAKGNLHNGLWVGLGK